MVKNISYSGPRTPKSIVKGRDENHIIENIIFENVVINGEKLREDNFNKYFISNEFVKGLSLEEIFVMVLFSEFCKSRWIH